MVEILMATDLERASRDVKLSIKMIESLFSASFYFFFPC